MSDPAGYFNGIQYNVLTEDEVKAVDSFSGFPSSTRLSKFLDMSRASGHIASAKLAMPNQPVDEDQLIIGDDVYMFLDAESTSLDDAAKIAVLIGDTAADTRANLIAAINATDEDGYHDSLFIGGDEDSLALANGTESVFADEVGTNVRIRNADAPGGNVILGTQDLSLSESITDASDVWNQTNLSATGRSTPQNLCAGTVVITSENLATDFNIELPFAPVDFMWMAFTTAGVPKTTTAIVSISGNSLLVNANAGGTALIATDIIRWQAMG